MDEYYILQIIENDDEGIIRDVDVTRSLTKAKKWFKKQPKTFKYFHAYQEIRND